MSGVVITTLLDERVAAKEDDPRVRDGKKFVRVKGGGRNTESFDPRDSIVRPDMRVIVEKPTTVMKHRLKHDDVVIVPDFFCDADDWSIYYRLIEEMREIQDNEGPKSDSKWISWAEGAHLISKDPKGSKTFDELQRRIVEYLQIKEGTYSTRFNWYRDSTDWKPYHHDSAAFNPQRARQQNITVGISFGATRELGFINATSKQKIYFPQTNGMLFTFGRDVNIRWKHGVNALAEEDQDGKGRISIILWGLTDVIDEAGSPPILDDNTRGGGYNMHKGPAPFDRDREVCRDFQNGRCGRGDSCRWLHRGGHERAPFRDRDFDENRRRGRPHRSRSRSRSRGRHSSPPRGGGNGGYYRDGDRDRDRDRDREKGYRR